MSEQTATQSQPTGLYVLFGAEAWERFSYYGMRALLVLYLVNHVQFSREHALEIYGLYTGLVYLTPLIGGALADKLLGRRKAVLIGGAVMALGHLAMAFESLLFAALGLLIVGNGFFKPNISTMVGGLFKEGDTRRDGAFTIFYMGINLGALFSPIVCGTLGEVLGWHFGFSAAAIGMGAGLLLFMWGQRHLLGVGMPPNKQAATTLIDANQSEPYRGGKVGGAVAEGLDRRDYIDVLLWTAGSAAFVFGFLFAWKGIGPVIAALPSAVKGMAGVLFVGAAFFQLFRGSSWEEAQRIVVVIVLCIFNIFFWMGFEQAGGTMTLFADAQTDRVLGGPSVLVIGVLLALAGLLFRRTTRDESSGRGLWLSLTVLFGLLALTALGYGILLMITGGTLLLPASQFQTINPLLIVTLAPSFSLLWNRLDSGRFRTSTPTKMALGMIILGLGFMVMYTGQKLAGDGKVSPMWLTVVYFIHTVGELCLSPIGLSMVTKLAPPRVVSLAMGLWMGSSAVANYLAGTLEKQLESSNIPIYGFLVVSSIGPALLLMALTPLLKKWMHGKA